jgi:hypothetical protein
MLKFCFLHEHDARHKSNDLCCPWKRFILLLHQTFAGIICSDLKANHDPGQSGEQSRVPSASRLQPETSRFV